MKSSVLNFLIGNSACLVMMLRLDGRCELWATSGATNEERAKERGLFSGGGDRRQMAEKIKVFRCVPWNVARGLVM